MVSPSSPSSRRGVPVASGTRDTALSRYGLLSVIGLTAVVLGAGIVYLSHPFDAARREFAESLGAISAMGERHFATWRHERLADAAVIARTPALAEFLRRPDATGSGAALGSYLEQARIRYRYESIAVLDRAGRTVLSVPADGGTSSVPETGRRAEAGAEPRLGDLRRYGDGKLAMELGQPIQDPAAGDNVGSLVFRIDPTKSLFPQLLEWPLPYRTGEIVLLRKEGDRAVVLSPVRKLPDPPLTLRTSLAEGSLLGNALAAGAIGELAEGADYRGDRAVGLAREITGLPWVLLAKVDADEVYGPARSEVVRVALMLGLALALAGVVLRSIWLRRRLESESERHRAELAQQDLAVRLGLVMQQANDGILLLDGQLRIVEVNQRATELHGWESGSMIGVDWREYFPGPAAAGLADQVGPPDAEASRVFESRLVRRDGTHLTVEISSRWSKLRGGDQLVSVVRDVSERETQRRRVARMNQLYQVLSHVNQAIVRAKDAESLGREICRICVEVGGFRMAWLGWSDERSGRIVPTVQWGDTTGYLDGIRIAPGEGAEGAGPSARSMLEGRTVVTQDFLNDPSTRPWWDRARTAGIRASIAIPLRRNGRVAGTLAVYAAEPGVFGPEEEALLLETAGDVSFAQDVLDRDTARRAAETALRESRARLDFLVSESPAVIYTADAGEGGFTFVSRNVEPAFGWTPAHFLEDAKHWETCVHPDDLAAAIAAGRELTAHGPLVREYRFRHRDGRYRWLRDEMRLAAEAGHARAIAGALTDVTDRKEAEEALRESEERHRSLFESMDFGVVYHDASGAITSANPAAARILGLPRASVAGRTSFDPGWRAIREDGSDFPGEDHPAMEALRTGRRVQGVRMGLRRAGEATVWIQIDAVPEFRPGIDGPYRVFAIFADITHRVQAEAELKKLSLAIEQNPVSILITDLGGAIEYVNPRLTAVTGYSPGELRGQTPRIFKSGLTPPAVYTEMWRTIASGGTWRGELTNCKKNGDLHLELVVIAPVKDAEGRPTHFVAIKEDITERRRIDDELRASEERYRLIADNTLDMIWLGDLQTGKFLYVSPSALRLRGFTPEELVGLPMKEVQSPAARRVLEVDLPERVAAFNAGDESARHRTYELDLLRKDGSVVATEVVTTLMPDAGGKAARILGVTRDVTERKRSEESLRKLSRIIEQAPLSVAITDLTGAIEYINPHFTRVTGYALAELQGKNPRLLKSGNTPDRVYREMWQTLTAGQVWRGELHNRKKNGELYVEDAVIAPVVDEAGKVSHYVALKQDVTERKRTEAALAESQARYRLIAENTDDVIWLYNLEADRFDYVSPSVRKLRGFSPEEVIGQRMAEVLAPESRDMVAAQLPRRLAAFAAGDESVRTQVHEVGQLRRDGGTVTTEVVTTLLRDAGGPVTGILGVTRDITARKAAEEALRRNRDRLADAERMAQLGNWEFDPRTRRLSWSDEVFRIFERRPEDGPPEYEAILREIHPAERAEFDRVFTRAVAAGEPWFHGFRVLLPDGRTKDLFATGRSIRGADGSVGRALGTVQDITERKAVENQLHDLVKELRALHGVATAMERPDLGRDELLADLVRHLPSALRFPAAARAAITLDGREYTAGAEGPWTDRLEAPVTINGRAAGTVALGYVGAGMGPAGSAFTAADREVVGSIARTIGLGLGAKESFAAVQRFNAELEDKVAQRTAELEARNREVQALLQSIPDMVVRLRTDGTRLHCQYAKGESALAQICAPGDDPAVQTAHAALEQRLLETGRRAVADPTLVAEGEVTVTHGGAELQLELRAARVAPDEFVAFVRDITARKRLETEMAATLEKERQVSEMKTRFISVTSHEFRTPMAAAVGTVELLRNHFERLAPAKRDEMFGRISGSLHRMTEMLDDLLLLNRMEAGRVQVAPAALDLAAFLREAVDEAKMADREAHAFAAEGTDGAVPFATDPQLLHHIVSNLLANAARYSPAGTTVAIRLELSPAAATIRFLDRGIGIPDSDRARIFQPFERGSNVGNIKGTGLGLSIVKRMTEMLGGSIALEPRDGGGSCFTLVLPIRPTVTLP